MLMKALISPIPMKLILRDDLSPGLADALRQAEAVLPHAWCPHSGFRVAASLLFADRSILTGVNYESDSFGLTLCAERAALAAAQCAGKLNTLESLILTASWADPARGELPLLIPCGACRQWLAELSQRLGKDIPIYSFPGGAMEGHEGTARALLPGSFQFKTNP